MSLHDSVANADFLLQYYISQEIFENDLKGAGPFIYASVEYEVMTAEDTT